MMIKGPEVGRRLYEELKSEDSRYQISDQPLVSSQD